jgi:hypothetical protein
MVHSGRSVLQVLFGGEWNIFIAKKRAIDGEW